jgi:hypothetical protein
MSELLITSLLILGVVFLILVVVRNEFMKIETKILALSEENWVLRDYSSSILRQLTEYKDELSSIKDELTTRNKKQSETWGDLRYKGYMFSDRDSKEEMQKDAERRLQKWKERQQRRRTSRS